jgi:hypothetical protein
LTRAVVMVVAPGGAEVVPLSAAQHSRNLRGAISSKAYKKFCCCSAIVSTAQDSPNPRGARRGLRHPQGALEFRIFFAQLQLLYVRQGWCHWLCNERPRAGAVSAAMTGAEAASSRLAAMAMQG